MTAPRPVGEAQALLSHLEPLLARRALLVLGPDGAQEESQAFLAERGLAATCALSEDGLAPGTFGLVLLHAGGPRPLDAHRVASLRARLAPGGLLAASISAGDARAEALLRSAFPAVQAASVVPLAAWAVAPDGPRTGALTWDGSALGPVRATARLLVCGDAALAPRGVTVTARPAGPAPLLPGPDLAAAARDALAETRDAEAREDALLDAWSRP